MAQILSQGGKHLQKEMRSPALPAPRRICGTWMWFHKGALHLGEHRGMKAGTPHTPARAQDAGSLVGLLPWPDVPTGSFGRGLAPTLTKYSWDAGSLARMRSAKERQAL